MSLTQYKAIYKCPVYFTFNTLNEVFGEIINVCIWWEYCCIRVKYKFTRTNAEASAFCFFRCSQTHDKTVNLMRLRSSCLFLRAGINRTRNVTARLSRGNTAIQRRRGLPVIHAWTSCHIQLLLLPPRCHPAASLCPFADRHGEVILLVWLNRIAYSAPSSKTSFAPIWCHCPLRKILRIP